MSGFESKHGTVDSAGDARLIREWPGCLRQRHECLPESVTERRARGAASVAPYAGTSTDRPRVSSCQTEQLLRSFRTHQTFHWEICTSLDGRLHVRANRADGLLSRRLCDQKQLGSFGRALECINGIIGRSQRKSRPKMRDFHQGAECP